MTGSFRTLLAASVIVATTVARTARFSLHGVLGVEGLVAPAADSGAHVAADSATAQRSSAPYGGMMRAYVLAVIGAPFTC